MTTESSLSRAERARQQLRADIVNAAFAEFAERGYHQTGIADIARRLGIGHGTFYRYFENKRDILDHVINDVAARITEVLAAENAPTAVTTLDDYRAQCQRISDRFCEFAQANPALLKLLVLEATSIDPDMTRRVFTLMELGGRVTEAYLVNGIERGFFRTDLDAGATAYAIVGMILAGIVRLLAQPDDPGVMVRYSAAAIRMLVDGVRRG